MLDMRYKKAITKELRGRYHSFYRPAHCSIMNVEIFGDFL